MGAETNRCLGFLIMGIGIGMIVMSLLVIFNELMTEGMC